MALFDTGAVLTYVREHLLISAPRKPAVEPFRVALGGRSIEVRELCLVGGRIEGLAFDTDAMPVQELGRADGHELDVILGALAMERWEIRLDPRTGTLDRSAELTAKPRRAQAARIHRVLDIVNQVSAAVQSAIQKIELSRRGGQKQWE